MRILLVNISRPTEIRIPQGLLYLASAICANGHEAVIHDEAFSATQESSFKQILSYNADVIGLSVYTLPWQLKRVEELSRAIKEACKNTLVIWGGWHPTLYPKHSILNNYVDVVIPGPGEKVVCELLDALKNRQPLKSVPGLVLKENGQIIETGPICMDPKYLYPPLNFRLIKLEAYLKRHDRGAGILQYITTRGCNAHCRFCIMAHVYKGNMIQKPQDQVLSELKYLFKHYAITAIHFSDDNTFRNDCEALQLSDVINDLTDGSGIPWRGATRINTLSNLSANTYKKLTCSGCEGVVVGIESGVDRVLRLMGKGINVSQIEKALEHLRANGLRKNLFSFLFNFTGETRTEAAKTLQLVRKTRLLLPESIIMLHVFFPGASDNNTVPLDTLKVSLPPLSEIFEQYYVNHIRNYRIGRIPINILRYYLNASEQRKGKPTGKLKFLRKLHQKIIWLRIKYGIFALPFEYHFSNIHIKKIKKLDQNLSISDNS
jgi:radical SAM superfamily enzyme YgiQ (UPF0313 family)